MSVFRRVISVNEREPKGIYSKKTFNTKTTGFLDNIKEYTAEKINHHIQYICGIPWQYFYSHFISCWLQAALISTLSKLYAKHISHLHTPFPIFLEHLKTKYAQGNCVKKIICSSHAFWNIKLEYFFYLSCLKMRVTSFKQF